MPVPGSNVYDLIERFRVQPIRSASGQRVGKGTFGEVTCERDPQNPETTIAIKRLDSTPWTSFLRELEILMQVQHPCIIEIKGWSPTDPGTFKIRMRFAANGTLRDHLGKGARAGVGFLGDRTRQACLICDIVMGMRHIHSCGFMHRDLKPENILLDENWRGLICDFGMSRSRSATGLPTRDAGTPAYAAPEQRQAGVYYTEKVDVFTFGLIAYEIIDGRWAFETPESLELRDPGPCFGPMMQNLIRRCWSSNPRARPSFHDILHEFEMSGWAILPNADANLIRESVSRVRHLERRIHHSRR
jgi:serine/threonine protein kinase